MKPADLLHSLAELSNHLDGQVVQISVELQSQFLGNILESFELEAQYQSLRRTGAMPRIDFLENEEEPLNRDDVETIEKAAAIHKKILGRLADRKKGKHN